MRKIAFLYNVLALTRRPFWLEKNAPIEHHCSHYTESWTYHDICSNELQLKDEQKESDARKEIEKKKKSPSKDSHDQPFNVMHLHDPLQLAMGARNEYATPGLPLYVYSWHRVFSIKESPCCLCLLLIASRWSVTVGALCRRVPISTDMPFSGVFFFFASIYFTRMAK